VEILREAGPQVVSDFLLFLNFFKSLFFRDYTFRTFAHRTEHTLQNLVSANSVVRYFLSILISVIGRILRLLATQHIFKEVAPDVFANNRISSTIDTYKSVAEINAKYVSLVQVGSSLHSHMFFRIQSPRQAQWNFWNSSIS